MLEIYKQITSELSKLENELINTSICSQESQIETMSDSEIYEAAQDLFWMAQEMQENSIEYDGEEFDIEPTYRDEIIDEVEILLEKLAEYL